MKLKASLCAVSLIILSACGGGGGGTSQQVGQFIDDPVGGLTYSCVSASQTITGTTDAQGNFNYIPGQTCSFKVGNVTLGTLANIPADGKVTPQDVAGVARGATNAPSAVVIAQFLQSLNDGSSSGKIVIPPATSTLLANAPATTLSSSSGSISTAELRDLVETVAGKTLVSAADATSALDAQISTGAVSASTGSVSPNATPVLNSITVTSSKASNPAGLTEQFTATGFYSNGSSADLTSSVSWSSSDSNLVSVNSSGLATGGKKGVATVTASLTPSGATSAIKGSTVQMTTDPVLQAIAVTNHASPPAGLTDQLIATGAYSDGSTADLTSSVTWASSNAAKLTVSTSGLATGVAVGSATVTASYTPSLGATAISGTLNESVLDPTPLNIVISYVTTGISSIQNTASTALRAILTFSDNTKQTVSSLVDWVVTAVSGGGNATVVVDKTANTATQTGTSPGVISTIANYLGLNNLTLSSNALTLTVTPLNSISGVAARGSAMSGATVSATCQGLATPITTTSGDNGAYSLTLPAGVTAPCLLSSTNVDGNNVSTTFYSSVASDVAGSNVTANITPITHLSVANAIGMDPATVTSLTSVAGSLTSNKLTSAATLVQTALNTTFGIATDGLARPFDSAIVPANPDSGINTNKQDFAVDQVMQLLNASSTPISKLVNVVSQSTNTNVAAAMTSFVADNAVPTSTSEGCPYATSGDYAIANVGSSNLKSDGTQNFKIVRIDFKAKKVWLDDTDSYSVTADTTNPCLFRITSTTSKKYISLTVSRAGFIVATSFDPPAASSKTASMRPMGTNQDCFTSDGYCSKFSIGIPVQSGIKLSELTGTWAHTSWNLSKYTQQTTDINTGLPTNSSEFPCVGASNGRSAGDGDPAFTCSQYVSYLEKAVIALPNNGVSAVSIYDCDGLYQGADITKTCSKVNQNQNVALRMVMCSVRNDCPTAVISVNGNSTTVVLRSVVDTIAPVGPNNSDVVISRSIAYRTPDNDLIAIGVSGLGGPTMPENSFAPFNNLAFQERLVFAYKPNGQSIPFPPVGSVVNRGQWTAADWNTGLQSATITTSGNVTKMTAAVLKSGTNDLAVGQKLVGNSNFPANTVITAITGSGSSAQYTLSNALTNPSITSYSNFSAVSQQVKEATQSYRITAINGKAVTRTYLDPLDSDANGNGYVDTVYLDTPVVGMIYRSPVFVSGIAYPVFNESLSARGHGFAISIGTATLRQQLGGIPAGQTIAVGCTMPGQTYSSSTGCGGVRSTGKFFTVNLTN